MAKRFSPEFKQQAIEYALANLHESLAAIARKFRQLRKEDILLMAGLV